MCKHPKFGIDLFKKNGRCELGRKILPRCCLKAIGGVAEPLSLKKNSWEGNGLGGKAVGGVRAVQRGLAALELASSAHQRKGKSEGVHTPCSGGPLSKQGGRESFALWIADLDQSASQFRLLAEDA